MVDLIEAMCILWRRVLDIVYIEPLHNRIPFPRMQGSQDTIVKLNQKKLTGERERERDLMFATTAASFLSQVNAYFFLLSNDYYDHNEEDNTKYHQK